MMENKVFMSFTFYSTILILKMYVVAIITGQVRLRKKAFANPEDALRNGGLQYYREDPDVERCRRAHRNDMENIFPFLFLGAIYSLLDPTPAVARIHFFIFCVGRIVHTVAYLLQLKAPTRSVAYSVAQLPCFSMALQILLATIPYCCFLLSTAAESISWGLQKALEMSRAALNRPAGEHRCSAVSPESRPVGEERLGPGYRRVTNPPELLCHAAVPKCQGLVQATAAPLWRRRQEEASAVQCLLPPLRATHSFTKITGGNQKEQKINSPSTCPMH
ncbi:prostaglandin E synthase [Nyctibius grandis]|uniref:prostaglandin E synthase n=1 Tax=Nyctibius grandis TaxID=48427 RepID=UPI0035BC6C52